MKKFILAIFLSLTAFIAHATILTDFELTYGNTDPDIGGRVTILDLSGQVDSFEVIMSSIKNEGLISNFLSPTPESKWSFNEVTAYRQLDTSELKTNIGLEQGRIDGSTLDSVGMSFRGAYWDITESSISPIPEPSILILLISGLGTLLLLSIRRNKNATAKYVSH